MRYALAVDIGASSGRHIIGYFKNGQIITEEIYRFPNGVKNVNGHLVWDIDSLFKEILTGLKKAKKLNKIPEVIGIDTWAVDYALLDEKDQLIDCIYAYRDSRTEKSLKFIILFRMKNYMKDVAYNINHLIQFINYMKIK